jgi:predicted DNA-binding transcriptional regulator AlpA
MKLITTKEAADMMGVKPSTLRGWRCANTGPRFTRLTKRSVMYAQADLERYIAERTFTPSVHASSIVNHSLTRDATPPLGSPAWHRRNR